MSALLFACAALTLQKSYALDTQAVTDVQSQPTAARAIFTVNRAGTLSSTSNTGTPVSGNWITPPGSNPGDLFSVEFHLSAGDLLVGTVDSYLALSSNRSIELNCPSPDSLQSAVRVRIKRTSDSVVVTEFTVNLFSIQI